MHFTYKTLIHFQKVKNMKKMTNAFLGLCAFTSIQASNFYPENLLKKWVCKKQRQKKSLEIKRGEKTFAQCDTWTWPHLSPRHFFPALMRHKWHINYADLLIWYIYILQNVYHSRISYHVHHVIYLPFLSCDENI